MSLILVRYCEIGLKSTPVRRRFEAILKDNMLTMLANDGIETLITFADARFFIETNDIDGCVNSVKKVFGIASISVAEECTSDMDDICRSAADYSVGKLEKEQSFAVKARREGNHPYTSMDVGREAGSAIFERNEDKGVKVDLTNPEKTFYIEVRNNKAYIFDSYIDCPGGLPLGSQGRVFADISDRRGMVSAWMMMKRGCRTMVRGDCDLDILKRYDPTLRSLTDEQIDGGNIKEILGMVLGTPLEGLDSVDVSKYDVPVYFPTIGMTDDDVGRLYEQIKNADF